MSKLAAISSICFIWTFHISPTSGEERLRFCLAMTEDGTCHLKIAETSRPIDLATKIVGEPVSLPRFHHAEILKSANGVYRFIHSFDSPDGLHDIFFTTRSARYESLDDSLTFWMSPGQRAGAWYWSRVRAPLRICYDRLYLAEESGLVTRVSSPRVGILGINLLRRRRSSTQVGIFFVKPARNGQEGRRTQILWPTSFNAFNGYTKSFKPPYQHFIRNEDFDVSFDAWSDDGARGAKITKLLVQGSLVPNFGLSFSFRKSILSVHKVVPGSLADRTGIETGDVILSMNDEVRLSREDAERILSNASIGDVLSIRLRSNGQAKTVRMIAE